MGVKIICPVRAQAEFKSNSDGRRVLTWRMAGARLSLACGQRLMCHSVQIALNYQTPDPVQVLDETFQAAMESSSYETF